MKSHFEPALHAFRGFAILSITAIHTFGFILFYAAHATTALNVDLLNRANEVLFHESTIYFALISGVLFSRVLAPRGRKAFFRSKLLNVVSPYVVMTCLFTWSHWSFTDGYSLFTGSFFEYLQRVGRNLLLGSGIFTYWYIPVLLVLYALTPLLYGLIKRKSLAGLLLPIVLLPLFFSRVWPAVSWTTYVYFIGVYTVGLYVGEHYDAVTHQLKQHATFIALLGVIATTTLWCLFTWDVEKWGVVSVQETAFYIQKLAFASLILLLFKRFANRTPRWLDALGNYAFPIYFLHGYLLYEGYGALLERGFTMSSRLQVMVFCVLGLGAVLAICLAISVACQRLLGRWSKHIMGA
jgi:membrane-bound acyltransferase YfiQ involved in biofilm formation